MGRFAFRVSLVLIVSAVVAASACSAPEQRETICLNGEWDFCGGGSDSSPPDSGWVKIRVPGSWGSWYREEMSLSDEMANADAAWYRLNLHIPKSWGDGRLIRLVFDGVDDTFKLWLGSVSSAGIGKPVGSYESGHKATIVDLTNEVTAGHRYRLLTRVWRARIDPPLYEIREPRFAGIWRSVYLCSLPRTHVSDTFVTTSVRKKQISSSAQITNNARAPVSVTVKSTVYDGSKAVLRLPDQKVTVPVRKTATVDVFKPWRDPVLWGCPPYGKPYLYFLKTEIVDSKGSILDTTHTRFGFREFWTSNTKFIFNGKPFFIKGDLNMSGPNVAQSRPFITTLFQAERGANINFIRLHELWDLGAQDWFDVADETGMLLEAQHFLRPERGPDQVRRTVQNWESWIPRYRNHPSLVMYSGDNELFSQVDYAQPEIPNLPRYFSIAQDVQDLIQSLDATRPIEWQGNVRLGTAQKQGLFRGLQVYNVHPYGNPLGEAMDLLNKQYDFPGNIPIHVGEMYSPTPPYVSGADFVRRNKSLYLSYNWIGKFFYRSMLSVRDHGAYGASLCAGPQTMYFGPRTPTAVALGPWDIRQEEMDYPSPDTPEGQGTIVNQLYVKVRYPSLSGEGMKVKWLTPHLGWGWDINFFDPSKPAYVTNVVYDWVKKGFKEVDGQDVGPLAAKRSPEIVAVVTRNGKAVEGTYVYCDAAEGQPYDRRGVMTDKDGTAWFVVPKPGAYLLTCPDLSLRTRCKAAAAGLKPVAGYAHVQFVDMGGNRAASIKAELAEPAETELRKPMANPNNRTAVAPPIPFDGGPFALPESGMLRHWLVCGPFPNLGDQKKGYSGYSTDWLAKDGGEAQYQPKFGDTITVQYPEADYWLKGKSTLKWHDLHSRGDFVALDSLKNPDVGIDAGTPQMVIGYCYCTLLSDVDTDCDFGITSDDQHQVWLNGKLIGEESQYQGEGPDRRIYKTHLLKGENRLMLKTGQIWGEWKFCARFMKDGKPVTGVSQVLQGPG